MNKNSNNLPIKRPWTQPHQKILETLNVSMETGLNQKEIAPRRKKYGSNRLRETKQKSGWRIFFEQFESLIMLLLAVATVLSFAFGQWLEGFAIIAVITFTVAIGFITEIKAVRSMEALRQLSRVSANVHRNEQVQQISAEELVPGDIVVLEGGDIVTADLRLIEANKLQADESALAGESTPVSKTTEALENVEVPLAECANMVFKGTSITRGSGAGVVVASGMNTELGTISTLVEEAEQKITPLERRIDQLGRRLIWITLGIAAVVAVIGIVRGKEIFFMIQTAIALAVAAIPEGLPIVATIALARGWHVFNMRDNDTSIFRNEITRNPYVWGALALCTILLLMAAYLPGLAEVLNVVDPGLKGWLLIISMSLAPLIIGQILKFVARE